VKMPAGGDGGRTPDAPPLTQNPFHATSHVTLKLGKARVSAGRMPRHLLQHLPGRRGGGARANGVEGKGKVR
jgi:hypothetical protein